MAVDGATEIGSHLLLDFNLEVVLHHVHQGVFAAGVQHPVSDAALVPGHGIDEDCKEKRGVIKKNKQ